MKVEKEKHHLIKIAQKSCENEAWFQEHKLILNLQRNTNDMYECRGRIQGDYPIYIPKDSLLAEKIVQEAYIRTIHGGVSLTMGKVRKNYWIPKFRGLAKKIRSNHFGCKRFQVTAFANPPPGALPLDRTVGNRAFSSNWCRLTGPLYNGISQPKKERHTSYCSHAVSCSSMLTWNKFEEVSLDIELTLNIINLEEASDNIDEYELRKRSRYVQKCEEKAWTR